MYKHFPKDTEAKICAGCEYRQTKTEDAFDQVEKLLEVPDEIDEKTKTKKPPRVILRSNCLQIYRIVEAVFEAFDLKETQNAGGTFVYPGSLNNYQWTCLKGYQAGYDKSYGEYLENTRPKS